MKPRKVYIMNWREVEMAEIKKGAIFRVFPASDGDYKNVNPASMYIATEDYKPALDSKDKEIITGHPVAIVKQEAIIGGPS